MAPPVDRVPAANQNVNTRRRIVKMTMHGAFQGAIFGGLALLLVGLIGFVNHVTAPEFKLDAFTLGDLSVVTGNIVAQFAGVYVLVIFFSALIHGIAAVVGSSPGPVPARMNRATNPWGTPFDADAERERRREAARVFYWRQKEFRQHLWAVAVIALFGVLLGGVFAMQGALAVIRSAGALGPLARGVLLCLAGVGIAAGFVALLIATIRRRPIADDPDPHGMFRPQASERPFDQRLTQYLDERPTPALGAGSSGKSPMALFIAWLPGPRRGPKSPSTIREILLRIRQLLRGNGT